METYISKDLILGNLIVNKDTKCYLLDKESNGFGDCKVFIYSKDLNINMSFDNDSQNSKYNSMSLNGMVFYIHIDFIYVKSSEKSIPLIKFKDRNSIITSFDHAFEI